MESGRKPSYPVIVATGSHYDVGFKIGHTCKDRVAKFLGSGDHLHFVSFSDEPAVPKVLAKLKKVTIEAYPQYMEELRGIADGCGVDFDTLFKLHVQLPGKGTGVKGCSTVFVHNEEACVLGHTEDNPPAQADSSCILDITITDGPRPEHFVAWGYPGMLAGRAFGFNAAGIAVTTNIIFPDAVNGDRAVNTFVFRDLLGARSLGEVKEIVYNPLHWHRAVSVNVGITDKENPRVFNFEIGASVDDAGRLEMRETEVVPVADAPNSAPTAAPEYYYHVNAYRHLQTPEETFHNHYVSSQHRLRRMQELPPPTSLDDVSGLLSDTGNDQYPIFRSARHPDLDKTVATSVYDLKAGKMLVYTDKPSGKRPEFVFLVSPSPETSLPTVTLVQE